MGLLSSPVSRQETAALHGACSARGIWNIKFAPRTPPGARGGLSYWEPECSRYTDAELATRGVSASDRTIGRSPIRPIWPTRSLNDVYMYPDL